MKPPHSILNPAFKYTSADHTDLRATFARVREEAAKREQEQEWKRKRDAFDRINERRKA